MMTFVYVVLFIIVFGALAAGIVTFLPSGVLTKMEDTARSKKDQKE